MSKSIHKIDLPVLTSNDLTPWTSALSKLGLTVDENNSDYAFFNSYTPIKLHITSGSVKVSVSVNGSRYYDKSEVSSSSVLNKNMSLFYYRFGGSGICFNILESNAQPKTNAIIIPANTNGGPFLVTISHEIWTYGLSSSSNTTSIAPTSRTLNVDTVIQDAVLLEPIHDGVAFRNDIYMLDYKSKSLSNGYYIIDVNNIKYLTYNVYNSSNTIMTYAVPLDLIWDDSQYT